MARQDIWQSLIEIWFRLLVAVRWFLTPANPRPAAYKSIIVSLTSGSAQIPALRMTLQSLLMQKSRPSRIVLWVNAGEFQRLPDSIRKLAENGLEIQVLTSLETDKKQSFDHRLYPDSFVIEAAPGRYYPAGWLASLVESWSGYQYHRRPSWAWD